MLPLKGQQQLAAIYKKLERKLFRKRNSLTTLTNNTYNSLENKTSLLAPIAVASSCMAIANTRDKTKNGR